jgi:uncharacterized protein (UPF0332 family)
MVTGEAKRTAEAHLRLAEAFIRTAQVVDTSSEVKIRNAFSRAYYAVFHACCAHVLASGTELRKAQEIIRRDHGRLRASMGRLVGKWLERFVKEASDRRQQADYKPGWLVPSTRAAQEELRKVRTNFYCLVPMIRRSLS